MEYYGNIGYGYLQHHGILGQKWGKRNGPPYPLDEADHSSSEKKAGWKKSLNLSEEQKRKLKRYAKIGAITVGSALALYGAYELSGQFTDWKIDGKNYIDSNLYGYADHEFPNDWKRIKPITDYKELAKNVNPFKDNKNCMCTSMAVDLKRKGIECSAKIRERLGNFNDYELWYKDADIVEIGNEASKYSNPWEIVKSDLLKHGNSWGCFGSEMISGSKHVMFYEVRNGLITFVDGQRGKVYSFEQYQKIAKINVNARYVRTDNLEIDTENIDMIEAVLDITKT